MPKCKNKLNFDLSVTIQTKRQKFPKKEETERERETFLRFKTPS